MKSLTAELAESLQLVRERGDTDAAKLHLSRGKMLVRDRVQALLDPGTPFLEFSPLAGWQMYWVDWLNGWLVGSRFGSLRITPRRARISNACTPLSSIRLAGRVAPIGPVGRRRCKRAKPNQRLP